METQQNFVDDKLRTKYLYSECSMCRLCLKRRRLSKSKNILQLEVRRMLKNCSSIIITAGDGLPTKICIQCYESLVRFHKFRENIEKTDQILQILLIKAKAKQRNPNINLNKEVNPEQQCSDLTSVINNGQRVKGNNENNKSSSENYADNIIEDKNVSTNDFKDINIFKNSSMHLENFSSKNEDIMSSVHNFESSGCTSEKNIFQKDIADTLMKSTEVSSNKLDLLLGEPPPLIPIKPVVNPKILSNVTTSFNSSFACNFIEANAPSNSLLQNVVSIERKSLVCNICKREFKDRKRLISHLKRHMATKDYKCKMCGKSYPNQSTFKIHMRSHTGERPFKCLMCNKGFTRWAGVLSHMQTHNDNRPHKCTICNKSFKISSNLERHKVLHSDIQPFCCNYCGKTFSQSENMQFHIKTHHTNEMYHLCNVCGKLFVSLPRLNRHMWTHSGFKPYPCNLCSKAYHCLSELKNHQRSTHSDEQIEKPFVCNVCDKRFQQKCRLSKHLKTHDRSFECNYCHKTFSSNNALDKHVKIKHSMN